MNASSPTLGYSCLSCNGSLPDLKNEKIFKHKCFKNVDYRVYALAFTDEGKKVYLVPRSSCESSDIEVGMEHDLENVSPALTGSDYVPSSISQSGSSDRWSESLVQSDPVHLTDDQINEYIITAVQNEPCLWDYRINVQERSNAKIDAAYESIAEQLGYRITKEEVKKRWEDFQEKYKSVRKALRGYRPSGSAAVPLAVENAIKSRFKYYDSMEFLNNTCDPVRTETSPLPLVNKTNIQEENLSQQCYYRKPRSNRKRSKVEEAEDLPDKLLEILTEKKEDPLDGFLLQVKKVMRKVPEAKQFSFEIDILNFIRDKLKNELNIEI